MFFDNEERVKLVKKRVLYLAGLVLLLGVGLVFIYTKSNNDVVENSINISPDVKPVSEVSESALKDLQDAEKNSTHLEFEDVIPYCPNISTVSDIHYSAGQNYNGITNEKDMLEQQYAFLERMHFDKYLNKQVFSIGYSYVYFIFIIMILGFISINAIDGYDFSKVTDMED